MLSQEAKKQLVAIMGRDYKVAITDEQAEEFGVSLLHLARLAVTALARAEDGKSSIPASAPDVLDPKTSV
jgi:hypothetical protein